MTPARDLIHAALKAADAAGSCNLSPCAFGVWDKCSVQCASLQAAVDAARKEGYDGGYEKGHEAGYDKGTTMGSMTVKAVFSACRRYRYVLRRDLGVLGGTGTVLFIMLNPSTADERDDDPTIRRCIDYGQRWGRAELVVCNLFAWRATDPRELPMILDPIGPENDRHIAREAMLATDVVCAWGSDKMVRGRAPDVLAALRNLGVTPKALRLSKDGNPWHPLYLPATLRPVEF